MEFPYLEYPLYFLKHFNKLEKAKKSNEEPSVVSQNAAPGASPSHLIMANQPGFSPSHVANQAPAFQNQMNYGAYPGQNAGQQNMFQPLSFQQDFQPPPPPNFPPPPPPS